MNGHDQPAFALPRDLLRAAAESEAHLTKLIQHVEGKYLVTRDFTLYEFTDESALKASDLQKFLSPITRVRGLDSKDAPVPPRAQWSLKTASWRVIAEFIKRFFKKIRDLICGPKTKGYKLSHTSVGALAGLAEWIMHELHFSTEMAKALACTILIGILSASKGTICEMTEEKALAALFAELN
jgi:hypothetical protein